MLHVSLLSYDGEGNNMEMFGNKRDQTRELNPQLEEFQSVFEYLKPLFLSVLLVVMLYIMSPVIFYAILSRVFMFLQCIPWTISNCFRKLLSLFLQCVFCLLPLLWVMILHHLGVIVSRVFPCFNNVSTSLFFFTVHILAIYFMRSAFDLIFYSVSTSWNFFDCISWLSH